VNIKTVPSQLGVKSAKILVGCPGRRISRLEYLCGRAGGLSLLRDRCGSVKPRARVFILTGVKKSERGPEKIGGGLLSSGSFKTQKKRPNKK